ncbi:hypothetical protein BH23GEM10_BH23GEM10_06320 [soil metagenome]
MRSRTRQLLATCVLAMSAVLGACSDSPSAPGPIAAVIEGETAANGQTAMVGASVAVAPAVIVRDGRGAAVAGTLVTFAVTRGGGAIASSSVRTGADGLASAGSWTLGTAAGVNEVTATVGQLDPVRFTATAVAPGPADSPSATSSAFTIDVRYIGSATARQRQAMSAAVARWRTVIVNDLPDVPMKVAAATCFESQPALNEVIDDILIFVEFTAIDGPGKILGSAGPCYVRSGSQLPVLGYIKLDSADLATMETAGTLDDVVLHEVGHVLGIGTVWGSKELLTGKGGADPVFHGEHALTAYLAMGVTGAAGVPVENTGGEGTRDGHWRESVFGNELMTGFIRGTPNPLSALTVASLKDLGYGTSAAGASTYTMGSSMQSSVSAVMEPIDLHGREIMRYPRYQVDRNGRFTPLDEIRRH